MRYHPPMLRAANIRRDLFVLCAFALLAAVYVTSAPPLPRSSAETRFVEYGLSGLQIVPASCPSSPHYAGECTAPPKPSSGCVIVANPTTVAPGEAVNIAWSTVTNFRNPYTRTINPGIGGVPWQGSTTVYPAVNTTFTLSATQKAADGHDMPAFSCSIAVAVDDEEDGQCTPRYFCSGSDLHFKASSCNESFVQSCAYACSNGACLMQPGSASEIRVNPALIRQNYTTQVIWSAENVDHCSISENSAAITDAWTGASGVRTSSPIVERTVYTLTCEDLEGTEFSKNATVNIIPTFEEQ